MHMRIGPDGLALPTRGAYREGAHRVRTDRGHRVNEGAYLDGFRGCWSVPGQAAPMPLFPLRLRWKSPSGLRWKRDAYHLTLLNLAGQEPCEHKNYPLWD